MLEGIHNNPMFTTEPDEYECDEEFPIQEKIDFLKQEIEEETDITKICFLQAELTLLEKQIEGDD